MYNLFSKFIICFLLVVFGLGCSVASSTENSPFNFALDDNVVSKNPVAVKYVATKDFQNKSIRVLISNKGSFEHSELILTSLEDLFITTNNQLVTNSASQIKITVQGDNFLVDANGVINKIPVSQKLLATTTSKPITFNSFNKLGKPANYIGNIEISLSKSGKLRVINVIDIEDYIRGVVPNEMPVYFGLEALKAQAVSARGYAYRDSSYKNGDYDVCDTTGSQVYNGYNSYDSISDKAVQETMGQFALYDGVIILSLYSSTSGGHTESYENAFSKNGIDIKFPSDPIPYLKGVPDADYNIDLSREKNAKEFYTSIPESFENKSPKYRWEISWTKEELESILIKNLMKNSSSKFITPALKNESDFGSIKSIDVPKRGVSGKAMYVRVVTDKAVFLIAKEITIRKIFENSKRWLPSANIVFEQITDGKKVVGYKVYGGGFGHGVGLSQFGAAGMAKAGYTYDKILKHYYSGVSIGSYPVECSLKNLQNCKSTFYANNKNAKLILSYSHKPHDLTIDINGNEISVATNDFNSKTGQISVSKYLNKGINTVKLISYDKSLTDLSGKVNFYVELEDNHEK